MGLKNSILDDLYAAAVAIHGDRAASLAAFSAFFETVSSVPDFWLLDYTQGVSLLHYAAISTSARSLRWVMQRLEMFGLTADCRDRFGRTPLHFAAQFAPTGVVPLLKALLPYGVDLEARTYDGGKTFMALAAPFAKTSTGFGRKIALIIAEFRKAQL